MRWLLVLALVAPALATNYTVKAGGGGSFTTITACMTQMSSNGTGVSDTCTVFAGSYTGNVTVPAGSVGNYKILNVNGSDVVTITGSVTMSSHSKIIGNCLPLQSSVTSAVCGFFITNPSAPTTSCIAFTGSTITDIFIEFNNGYECGGVNFPQNATHNSYIELIGNTFTYMFCIQGSSGTNGCLNTSYGTGFAYEVHCDNCLFDSNDSSHNSDHFTEIDGNNLYIRKNSFHDSLASECGTTGGTNNSSNCHIDGVASEPNVVGGGYPTNHMVIEQNTQNNTNDSAGAHCYLQQADTCNQPGNCTDTIVRFNQCVHVGTAGLQNDAGWTGMFNYNNTEVDVATNFGGPGNGAIADGCSTNATDCEYSNNIYYYLGSLTVASGGFNAIGKANNGVLTSAVDNMAFCTVSCAGLFGTTYGSGTWTGSGQLLSDPKLVAPSTSGTALGNNALQSSSPARNAGTSLTTANGSGTASTALIVGNAGPFQANPGAVPNVQADGIKIGSWATPTILISSINYATNTLNLATPTSWSNGAPVWICSLSDGTNVCPDTAAPDIGAVPFVPSTLFNVGAPSTDGFSNPELCGWPDYACSLSNVTAASDPTAGSPAFTGITGAPGYNAQPEPSHPRYLNTPLIRITDWTFASAHIASSDKGMGPNCSGNGFDIMWDVQSNWMVSCDSGNVKHLWQVDPTTSPATFTWVQKLTNMGSQPNFSTVTPAKYYFMDQTIPTQVDYALATNPATTTKVFDFAAVCSNWDATRCFQETDPPLESYGDLQFSTGFEPSGGGQNSGRCMAVYTPSTNKCYWINFSTTQIFGPSGLIGNYNPLHGTLKIHQISQSRGLNSNISVVGANDEFAVNTLTPGGSCATSCTVTATYMPQNDTTQAITGESFIISNSQHYNNTYTISNATSSTFQFTQTSCAACGTESTLGTGTVNTSGKNVTYVSGTNFNTSWLPDQIIINGVTYSVASITSTTALVLTTSAGTQTGVSYTMPSSNATVNNDNGGDPFAYIPGNSDLSKNCAGVNCSGHWVGGHDGFITDYNQSQMVDKSASSPGTVNFTFPAGDPCSGHQATWDMHPNILPLYSDNGLWAEFGSTSGTIAADYTKPCTDEIIGYLVTANSPGTVKRFAHCNSGLTWHFNTNECIVAFDQIGRFFTFSSNMNNSLGDNLGNNTCTAGTVGTGPINGTGGNCRPDLFVGDRLNQ